MRHIFLCGLCHYKKFLKNISKKGKFKKKKKKVTEHKMSVLIFFTTFV